MAAANLWHFKELTDRQGKRALERAGVATMLRISGWHAPVLERWTCADDVSRREEATEGAGAFCAVLAQLQDVGQFLRC